MGLIVSIIIGGIAGWIAEKLMKADHGLITNILLGITGATVFNFLIGIVGFDSRTSFLGGLLAGVVGACLLIWAWRMLRGKS
ncbi:Uncharacterized membrane protein YeaQ/YmgE, transglycosylase-associated protein family [Monaibacterium marinum]|uniref:Uncharacterized membrane protein YeaQ/YmgE, transglycosylase-associated protein family n=1 Tax=Pontivivens marinum TaxID=1690039 RepID=A0A2C9CTE8_9RHOB|nr:GlsB/YeaQ/YmgE family stress response membrane protein [Monaibacterium marinum]SOH94537.1 Uncharacterized membrane protein YeaQ/YmgE, transglycosylase-associated protein family [Monaibacterium marinum]